MKNPLLAIINPGEIRDIRVLGSVVSALVSGRSAQVAALYGRPLGGGRFAFSLARWRTFLAALRPARASRRNDGELAELSHQEAKLGSGLPHEAAQVLREVAQTFAGGQAFTRAQLAQELAGRLRSRAGRTLSPASTSIAASKALTTLETRGLVRRIGRGLNAQGRPGAERFLVTLTGEDRALGDQIVAQESAGESLAAREIARREALADFLGGPRAAPGKGPVYRPVIHRQKTKGHQLPKLTKKRLSSAGYRTCNPPLETLPFFDEACRRYEEFHGVAPRRVRRVRIDDGKKTVTRKVVAALGTVPVTAYQVPFDPRSNKHVREKGKLVTWEHDHPKGGEPLECLDPETGLTFKIPGPRTRIGKWWED